MGRERSGDANALFWARAAERPAWYVLEAQHGEEFALAVTLAVAISAAAVGAAEVLHLVDEITVTRRLRIGSMASHRVKAIRKISRFGPLLFVRAAMTRPLAEALVHMPKARGLVCPRDSSRPVVVADDMIEFYRSGPSVGGHANACEYAPGDVVRVTSGPAVGQRGEVMRVDNGRALRLDTHKFGGSAPLIIEAGHVELVELCRRRPIEHNVKRRGP